MPGFRVFVGFVVAMVAATIGVGLYLGGSPSKERERQADNTRLNDLQSIASMIDGYYGRHDSALPATLDEAAADAGTAGGMTAQLADPDGAPYEYRRTGDATFELCATFALPSDDRTTGPRAAPYPKSVPFAAPYGGTSWDHGAGRTCFPLDETERMPRQSCSLTNPCAAGLNCVQLPTLKGAVCVPAGKECLAAKCPQGACAIEESYPAKVTCAAAPPASNQDLGSGTGCALMRNAASGKIDCFGCAGKVCKEPTSSWRPYAPTGGVGVPYACYATDQGCALAQ